MIYVSSDLHGCAPEVFQSLLKQAGFTDNDFLFILGDVIDRGAHGAELLLWLTQQSNMQMLLGNHESMLLALAFLFDEVTEQSLSNLNDRQMRLLELWFYNGGRPTLSGLEQILKSDPELLQGILDYLRELPLYEVVEAEGQQYILVHAGLGNFRPDKPLSEYSPEELLWERPSLDTRYYSDATVIFGHTPTLFYGEEFQDKAIFTDTWINIDTGAASGGKPMLLRLDDQKPFYWKDTASL